MQQYPTEFLNSLVHLTAPDYYDRSAEDPNDYVPVDPSVAEYFGMFHSSWVRSVGVPVPRYRWFLLYSQSVLITLQPGDRFYSYGIVEFLFIPKNRCSLSWAASWLFGSFRSLYVVHRGQRGRVCPCWSSSIQFSLCFSIKDIYWGFSRHGVAPQNRKQKTSDSEERSRLVYSSRIKASRAKQ